MASFTVHCYVVYGTNVSMATYTVHCYVVYGILVLHGNLGCILLYGVRLITC